MVLYGSHTVLIQFFTHAYTWYPYTIMALTSPHSKVHTYGSIQFLYGSLQMPTHRYPYTMMALTSPHSQVCIYGSIWFPYSSYMVLYTCLHRVSIYHNGIGIPSFQSLHIWFYTVPVQFLYGSLHMPKQGIHTLQWH